MLNPFLPFCYFSDKCKFPNPVRKIQNPCKRQNCQDDHQNKPHIHNPYRPFSSCVISHCTGKKLLCLLSVLSQGFHFLHFCNVTGRHETIIFVHDPNIIPGCAIVGFDRIAHVNKIVLYKKRILLDPWILCTCPGAHIEFCCIHHSHPLWSLVKMDCCFCGSLVGAVP